MVSTDALNSCVYPLRKEMTAKKHIPILHVCSTDKSELNEFLVKKNLSRIYSTDEDESKGIIIDNFL